MCYKYHFIFNQVDADSTAEAARVLLHPGCERLLGSLQPGECVMRDAQGRWASPILMRADYVAPSREPRPEHFDREPFQPAKRLHELPSVQEALRRYVAQKNKIVFERTKFAAETALESLDLAFLRQAACAPELTVARDWDVL